jgi:cob(I)alamin adenosyltransferase
MCPIYTREGDEGYTGLLGKGRFSKNELRFECLGDIDEANSAFALARSMTSSDDISSIILKIQRDLYSIMSELATEPDTAQKFPQITNEQVIWIETQIKMLEGIVQIPDEFILPGDSASGAAFDLARTVVRRAERHIIGLFQKGDIKNIEILHYLNRLSSLCFVLELFENRSSGQSDISLAKK